MKKRFSLLTLILSCICCIAVSCLVYFLMTMADLGGTQGYRYARKYAQVAKIIEEQYIGESDPELVSDASASAMISSLGDRWSYYMTAEQYESYRQYVSNSYTGIGVTIRSDEQTGALEIVTVTAGGPAEQAGVLAGDLLLAIDGESVIGKTTDEVKSFIQARSGETLALLVRRADGSEPEIAVKCGEVRVEPVSFELLEGKIGYIQIRNFEANSAKNAISAVEELSEQGAESLIFDVRSDPGGRVSELTRLLDYLLPEGDIFVSVSKAGVEQVTRSDSDCVSLPMVVLVNADSYSAAELFAETLREYGAAQIVGEATTGKGRSQITIELKDGSAVHLSTNKYLTPDRIDLSEAGGLVPDYEIEHGKEGDAQLEKAMEILS